ncbi:hypothetical protein MBLNU230_g7510t1 [Neophaeotheca triangularis]
MFYSHEVLTSRKYGVATVWLVATLGSKSTLKKVSRKAILDVDVAKACETIVAPEAPMALRLQSNLLFGVTRVYAQQCGYVLNDAENAKNNMRMIIKAMRTSALISEGGHKAKADQIVLQDDPNFLPDFDMPMDLDMLDLDLTTAGDSQRTTLSPHGSQMTDMGSQQSIGGLIIPPSASSFGGGDFRGLSLGAESGVGSRLGRATQEPAPLYEDDLGLAIDDDGDVAMRDQTTRHYAAPSARGTVYGSDAAGSAIRQPQADDDNYMPIQDDDYEVAALPQNDQDPSTTAHDVREQQETSTETAEAPQRRRAKPVATVPHDPTIEIGNRVLAQWQRDYLENMSNNLKHKNTAKAAALAKKNAEYWVLGIDSLGVSDQGPLSIFTGTKLLETLLGSKLGSKDAKKRAREDEPEVQTRRVRSRSDQPPSDELGRGGVDPMYDEDGYILPNDDSIEQGRDAPTPLADDRHLSNTFPWNQSTGSRRPTALFGSAGGGGGFPTSAGMSNQFPPFNPLSRRGSRLVSASPLHGRGPGPAATHGGSETDELQLSPTHYDADAEAEAEAYELHGPAAAVDTQTAAQTQWQSAILDGESANFFTFVQAAIAEADAGAADDEDEALRGSIEFEALLPPKSNSAVVAAQALLHVLALGTRGLVAVEQREDFGAIGLRVAGAGAGGA